MLQESLHDDLVQPKIFSSRSNVNLYPIIYFSAHRNQSELVVRHNFHVKSWTQRFSTSTKMVVIWSGWAVRPKRAMVPPSVTARQKPTMRPCKKQAQVPRVFGSDSRYVRTQNMQTTCCIDSVWHKVCAIYSHLLSFQLQSRCYQLHRVAPIPSKSDVGMIKVGIVGPGTETTATPIHELHMPFLPAQALCSRRVMKIVHTTMFTLVTDLPL